MTRLKGTSWNSKGERFFDLLSDRPLVRLQTGVPKTRRKLFIGLRRVFIFFWNYNVSFKSSGSFRRHQPAR